MTTTYADGPDGRLWIVTDDGTYADLVAVLDRLGIDTEES